MSDIPYIEIMEAEWGVSYKPFKPTGRWKIESCAYYRDRLFIEHQGFIFKSWIPEDDIKFLPAKKSIINACTQ